MPVQQSWICPQQKFSPTPDLYRLEVEQLRETLAVMQAQNINVVDLPGTPVRLLAFAVRTLPLAISRPSWRKPWGADGVENAIFSYRSTQRAW